LKSKFHLIFSSLFILSFCIQSAGFSQIDNYKEYTPSGRGLVFATVGGNKIKFTPYGSDIIRVQALKKDEELFPDDYYEMVVNHNWNGKFNITEKLDSFIINTGESFILVLKKNPMRIEVINNGKILFSEAGGIEWNGNNISETFTPDSSEHFTGLGHGFFGRSAGLDLKGQVIGRNYGSQHGDQSPLIVPFYMSSNGYGIFLNSTFTNQFSFNHNGNYSFNINTYGDPARMDYFIIIGPRFSRILDLYTQLTGRPRLPSLAIFGLGLSDKSNDENSNDPSDENWWKRKVTEERNSGLPIDHLINDNRWRAGGGKRCDSYFDWDKERFPDPAEYASWLNKNGLITTIDFNRCIGSGSEGWMTSFNIPYSDKVDHNNCVPDFTCKEVRNWFWGLFWNKSLNPKLHFPGDALWVDEFDELGPVSDTVHLGNGKLWGEMKNYYPFLIAKALVQEGWDKTLSSTKRPFVWIRGMTAGAQRYATLWTGDIKPTYEDMKNQIIAMQLAGLSGFPFEGHDAGGFYDWDNKKGPDETLYRKWSMALGCFTPFWKPHGMGQSRWPLDRSPESLETAQIFTKLRYQLLPYTYTYAHLASESGLPLVRPMIIDYQNNPLAWNHDMQFMWGDEILVIPNPSEKDSVDLWLPEGKWYDYWTNKILNGNKIIEYYSPVGSLVLFAREGSMIPLYYPALGTSLIIKDELVINVYTGKDGKFILYEDDGITEMYKKGENRRTLFTFNDSLKELIIHKSSGHFKGEPQSRKYEINFIGDYNTKYLIVNGEKTIKYDKDINKNILSILLKPVSVNKDVHIRLIK
jgi:alpha-D-xyloside xylohydrolase